MKILLLVTGGRGGSDFFQGLLDGHSEILQFPGYLYQHNLYLSKENIFEILSLKDPEKIANSPT